MPPVSPGLDHPDNIEMPIWKLRQEQAERGKEIMHAFPGCKPQTV